MALTALFLATSVRGGEGGTPRPAASSLAAKEIAKREAQFQEAQAKLIEAKLLFDKGKFDESLHLYREAYDVLPAAPLTVAAKQNARDGYTLAANAQARLLADQARYAEARVLLKTVLEDSFNPGSKETATLLKQLDDPERYSLALTPEHKANVAQVSKLLIEGAGHIDLGNFDEASAKYNAVLRLDPYNSAARRGLERIEQHKALYFGAARDQTRAKMLNEVNAGWEQPVPVLDMSSLFGTSGTPGTPGSGKDSIVNKLNNIIIPAVDLSGATLDEVVEFLRIRSRELDPARKGISLVLKVPAESRQKPVTLNMAQVPLIEVLRYITEATGTTYRVEEFAVSIISMAEKSDVMQIKKYLVPPTFIQNAPAGNATPLGAASGAQAPANPFAPGGAAQQAGAGTDTTIRRLGAKDFLTSMGVSFPGDATATYNAGTSTLFVRNTAQNLALIDALVEQASSTTARQVEIQVKLLEINQNNLSELGFDWLLGQSAISSRLTGSGGTAGNGPNGPAYAGGANFPITTVGGNPFPNSPNPITAGNRSGNAAFAQDSINSLLNGANTTPPTVQAPGIFGLAGVFSGAQFEVLMRGLSQKKGRDLLASPTVVTKSGQRVSINVSREMRYPTEFTPPQIPTSVGGATVTLTLGGVVIKSVTYAGNAPIVGTTPTAFEKRDVGITLEVEPVVSEDGRTVDLNIAPSSVDFEGFINYGSPIKQTATFFNLIAFLTTPGTGLTSASIDVPNAILQPVFRTNKVSTSATVWDGQTVVLGGVTTDRRIDVHDKVPILGSLPFIGRSFQSKGSSLEKKAVIFFVTVRVIDPGGQRVNQPAATVAR